MEQVAESERQASAICFGTGMPSPCRACKTPLACPLLAVILSLIHI